MDRRESDRRRTPARLREALYSITYSRWNTGTISNGIHYGKTTPRPGNFAPEAVSPDYDLGDMGAHKKKLHKHNKKSGRRALENAIEKNGHHEKEKGKKKKS